MDFKKVEPDNNTSSSEIDLDLVSSFESTDQPKRIDSSLISAFVEPLISKKAAFCSDHNGQNDTIPSNKHDLGRMNERKYGNAATHADVCDNLGLKIPIIAVNNMAIGNTNSTTATPNATTIICDNDIASSQKRHKIIYERGDGTAKNVTERRKNPLISCMPHCLGGASHRDHEKPTSPLIKPIYNSLCTKCMSKDDRIPRGFKGLIIQTPSTQCCDDDSNQIDTLTPTFDRSNIVQQTALVNGMCIGDVYQLCSDKLGKGSYGNVVKGYHRETNALKAVKIIRKAKIENAMRMKREIQIMKTLDHPNIIKLFEVYEDPDYLYLIMEMCSGGELFDRIVKRGCFTEQNAACIMRQIFSAISYCHKKNILHRDLKPENILYSNSNINSPIKIIDWGFATKCFKTHKFSSLVGTPYYVAPEVLLGNYDKACDIWSAGVILFILLVGYPPFHGNDNSEILRNVKSGCVNFVPQHWSHVSPAAMDLITRCLSYVPKRRINADDALNHEWILRYSKIANQALTVAPSLSRNIIKRFKEFLKFNKMKQLALTCIAYHMTELEIGHLNTTFEAFDKNGDGVLTIAEVLSGLKSPNKHDMNDHAIKKLIEELDTDGNGIIEYTEFIAATIDEKLYKHDGFCKKAFNVFDIDGDGKITREDMMRVLRCDPDSNEITVELIDEILDEVDLDKDGMISYDEFFKMLHDWPNRKY